MNCPICGKPIASTTKTIAGKAVCNECYEFFTDKERTKKRSRSILSFLVEDYSEKVSSIEDQSLTAALKPVLLEYASFCGIELKVKMNGITDNTAVNEGDSDDISDASSTFDSIICTTLDSIPGMKVTKIFDVSVSCLTGFFKLKGGLTGILSANSLTLNGALDKAKRKLKKNAYYTDPSINAILGFAYHSNFLADDGYTMIAYGTPVHVKPVESEG